MFGYAVGVIGLRPDDFYSLSLDEFNDISTAFIKYNSNGEKEDSILEIEDLPQQIAEMNYWYG